MSFVALKSESRKSVEPLAGDLVEMFPMSISKSPSTLKFIPRTTTLIPPASFTKRYASWSCTTQRTAPPKLSTTPVKTDCE